MQPLNTVLAFILLCSAGQAVAQSKKQAPAAVKPTPEVAAPSADKKDDKVDISDLEKKYWAPKDTDFSVVQNRTYTKEKAIFVTLQGGPLVNDHYSEGYIYGGTLNYFFSERYGLQATYLSGSLDRNQSIKDLEKLGSGVQPNYGQFQSYYGLGFSFVPFYAKMSFMGKRIMYFDMAITPTVGMTTYEQTLQNMDSPKETAFTYGLDITQYFFLTENFAIRADLKNQWFTEDVRYFRAQGAYLEGDKVKSETTQNTMFLLGLTLYFK